MPIIGYHYILDPKWTQFNLHGVSMENFCSQLDVLEANFEMLSLDAFLTRKLNNDPIEQCCALIFDDGMVDHYHAARELHRRGLTGSFFPIASVYDGRIPLTMKTHILLSQMDTEPLAVATETYMRDAGLEDPTYQISRSQRLVPNLRMRDDVLTANVKEVFARLPVEAKQAILEPLFQRVVHNEEYVLNRFFMQEWQLKEMLDWGMDIGSHGYHHTSLKWLTREQQEQDILRSKDILENILSSSVTSFSLPFGDYNEDTHDVLTSAGFLRGVCFNNNDVSVQDDQLFLSVYDCKFYFEHI